MHDATGSCNLIMDVVMALLGITSSVLVMNCSSFPQAYGYKHLVLTSYSVDISCCVSQSQA